MFWAWRCFLHQLRLQYLMLLFFSYTEMYLQPIKPFPWELVVHDQRSALTWKWKESRTWAAWETLERQGIILSHFPQTTFFWNDASSESPHPGSPSPKWGKGSHHQVELGAVLSFSELEASLHYITPGRISEINEWHLVRFNRSQCLDSHWRCNHKFSELWTTP